MNTDLLLENLKNPALLFFALGVFASRIKSDLEIPANSSKFISLYLLFSIGFKGGQELAHADLHLDVVWSFIFGIIIATAIPVCSFYLLRKRLGTDNAGAIAAAYGSVSAVTFVTAVTFLENQGIHFGGHMVAIMALMEAPAIIIGVLLIRIYTKERENTESLGHVVQHAFTNGSVLLILGSLVIGFMASEEQAAGIKPFTTDLFKGFLAIFLLDMGITSGKKLNDFFSSGWIPAAFAMIAPIVNGSIVAYASCAITPDVGNRFIFAILAASASYIAVPAAMKIAAPKANPGIFLPMALAITFPVNITLGIPIYYWIASAC